MKKQRCYNCGELARVLAGTGETTWGGNSVPRIRLLQVPRYICESCGEETFGIPHVQELQGALKELYVTKPAPLSPPERRHLRKLVGWSLEDTAERLGVSPSKVRRWESRRDAINNMEELALRCAVLLAKGVEDYDAHEQADIGRERARVIDLVQQIYALAAEIAAAREREASWETRPARLSPTDSGWTKAPEMAV